MQRYVILLAALLAAVSALGQQMPERREVRKGNRLYNKGEYQQSIERYGRALMLDPASFEATYNLGNALSKAEMYDKAEQMQNRAAADTLRSDTERAEAYYNLGNTQFRQKKYREALESYKRSLLLNPDDREAKYNYAYTKHLLDDEQKNGGGGGDQNQQNKDQQNQQGQNNQNQNQNQQGQGQDQNKDQNKDQGQDNQDQNKDQGQGQPDGKDGEQGEGEGQPRPEDISPQEQEQMLDAIQAQEDRTQEKLKEKRRAMVVRSGKNW
ncbi:MAG TPA: tetratricopeptide repeat protein [Candidatus Alistipes excrementigallinarum]|nr:tetratricopeptide repeat protein [Candidatus Alistipes excrementigallinarum]